MPEVHKLYFDNIYVADEHVCKNKTLPSTRFAIEYPNNVEASFPNNKRDHIVLQKKSNDTIFEEISIGFSSITNSAENKGCALIENLVENLQDQLPDLKTSFIGEKEFYGKLVCLFEGEMNYTSLGKQGYEGIYKIIILLPLPNKNEDMPGVLFSLIANEKSEIQSFDDFKEKGMIHDVYKTFRYIE